MLNPGQYLNFWKPDANALGDGDNASPIYVNNASQSLSFMGGTLVIDNQTHFYEKATASKSYLIVAASDGQINFTNTNIDIQHAQNGIRVGDTTEAHQSSISITGGQGFQLIADHGNSQHHGLTTYWGGAINIETTDKIIITTAGENSTNSDNSAVQLTWGGNVTLTSNEITLTSETRTDSNNFSIYASSHKTDATVELHGKGAQSSLILSTKNAEGIGIYTYAYSADHSAKVELEDFYNAHIESDIGIYARARDGDTLVQSNSIETLTMRNSQNGIYVQTGYDGHNGSSRISLSAKNIDLQISNGTGIEADSIINQTNSSIDLEASGSLQIISPLEYLFQIGKVDAQSGSSTLSLNKSGIGRTILNGDGWAYNGGKADIYLNTNDSIWTGASFDSRNDPTQKAGEINVTAKNGAWWLVRPNRHQVDTENSSKSYLTKWNSVDHSNIDLRLSDGSYQAVDIDHLTGKGAIFWMNTDVNGAPDTPTTDQAVIHHGTGKHQIHVDSTGKEPWTNVQSDYLVHHLEEDGFTSLPVGAESSGNDDALSFTLANANGVVDVGLYLYKLASRPSANGGTEWYLERVNKPTDPDPSPDDPETPAGDLVTSLVGMQPAIYWAQLSNLRERLGEIRYGAQDGLWVRVFKQKEKLSGMAHNGYKQTLYGVNLGLDHLSSVNEDEMWLLGANLKYINANQQAYKFADSKGDLKGYGLNLYATYAHHNGAYADFVLSADTYKQDLHTRMTDLTPVKGHYNTYGLGASIELGRMFSSKESDEGWGPWYNHWFIEPQSQLSYYWVKGKSFTLDNSMTVSQDNAQSLVGRLGIVVGKKWNHGEPYRSISRQYHQAYLKGGLRHEFLADQTITVNQHTFNTQQNGTRWYYGAGLDWNLKDQLKAYAEFERESGNNYDKSYEISLGLKYEF